MGRDDRTLCILMVLSIVAYIMVTVFIKVEEPQYVACVTYINDATTQEESEPQEHLLLLGEYTITAYCSCEKCCGIWALNRPNNVVYGAYGIELNPNVSCASNSFDKNTLLMIEGLGTFVVLDRTAEWVDDKYDNKLIDIYFADHDDALDFGVHICNVWEVIR